MFSKISRYRKLPNVVTLDARSRALESKSLRLTPEVPTQTQHILEGSDRLDQVAYKYYQQPRNWWRICDANAEFDSPRALFGKSVTVTGHFHLERTGPTPFWPDLRRTIAALEGVMAVILGTADAPWPVVEVVGETVRFDNLDPGLGLPEELDAAVRGQQLPAALVLELETRGVLLSPDIRLSVEDGGGYLLADPTDDVIHVLRPEPDALIFVEQDLRHHWTAEITFNRLIVTAEDICAQISALGCQVNEPEIVGRIGKPIEIPRRARS